MPEGDLAENGPLYVCFSFGVSLLHVGKGGKNFSANIFYMDLKMNFQKLISGTAQFEALLTSTRHEGLIDEPGQLEITDLPISMLLLQAFTPR